MLLLAGHRVPHYVHAQAIQRPAGWLQSKLTTAEASMHKQYCIIGHASHTSMYKRSPATALHPNPRLSKCTIIMHRLTKLLLNRQEAHNHCGSASCPAASCALCSSSCKSCCEPCSRRWHSLLLAASPMIIPHEGRPHTAALPWCCSSLDLT